MKYIALYCTLLTLVSCESNNSKKKNCTLNDQKVDCSLIEPVSTPVEAQELKAQLTSAINVSEQSFEILENNEDIKEKTVGGHDFSCGLNTVAGKVFNYKIEGNKLTLTMSGVQEPEVFDRLSGTEESLYGVWRQQQSDEAGTDTLTLNFNQNTLTMSLVCKFNEE